MANPAKRLPTNTPGNFYVDATCINCDTCRQLAPRSFVEIDDLSSVRHQPRETSEMLQAYQALLACPVGSIGVEETDKTVVREAMHSFPLRLDGSVYYCGFNSEKSFGGNSYFVEHPGGNWLIDSPRYMPHLIDAFERLGGIAFIFLTHEDDVADAARYAKRFGAQRIIHRADMDAQPGAEWVIDGTEPQHLVADFRVIPVPGHTEGSIALLHANRYLFSGDHLWWDRELGGLDVPNVYVWNESALIASTERLLHESFEWVLPGHGERVHLASPQMREALERTIRRRKSRGRVVTR